MARRGQSMYSPSVVLFRSAMRKGNFGDSRVWKAVGIAMLARRGFKKIMGTEPRTIAVERIKPGETVILRGVRSRDVPTS